MGASSCSTVLSCATRTGPSRTVRAIDCARLRTRVQLRAGSGRVSTRGGAGGGDQPVGGVTERGDDDGERAPRVRDEGENTWQPSGRAKRGTAEFEDTPGVLGAWMRGIAQGVLPFRGEQRGRGTAAHGERRTPEECSGRSRAAGGVRSETRAPAALDCERSAWNRLDSHPLASARMPGPRMSMASMDIGIRETGRNKRISRRVAREITTGTAHCQSRARCLCFSLNPRGPRAGAHRP